MPVFGHAGEPSRSRWGEMETKRVDGPRPRADRRVDGGAFLRRVRRRACSSVRFDPCRYGEADATDELDPSPHHGSTAQV